MPENTAKQYFIQWVDGDETAFRKVFDHYYPKLLSACHRSIRQKEDCEEIVLNVFLKIWQRRGQLVQVENFENYLFASLSNQITDFHRRKLWQTENIEQLPLAALGNVEHPQLSFKELEKIYQHALDKLPEKQRMVFLMSREQGLSQKQIAEEAGISLNTVNNHIKSAVKKIRRDMGQYSNALPLVALLGSSCILR